jgi:hypothetical protein
VGETGRIVSNWFEYGKEPLLQSDALQVPTEGPLAKAPL